MNIIKRLLRAITPYGLLALSRRFVTRKRQDNPADAREKYHEERRKATDIVAQNKSSLGYIDGHDYESIVQFLVGRNVPEHHVREGSIPLGSLEFIDNHAIRRLTPGNGVVGLHIGNFVGVSLVYITKSLVEIDPGAICISVDPNLTHRGVTDPQTTVLSLLTKCNLQKNSIVIAGYSGLKSISNDATTFSDYDPVKEFQNESACENVISNLARLLPSMVDLIFLDGNHEASYLQQELHNILPLLRPGGFVILDDIDEAWDEIRQLFLQIDKYGFEAITQDGRVGIARYLGSE